MREKSTTQMAIEILLMIGSIVGAIINEFVLHKPLDAIFFAIIILTMQLRFKTSKRYY